MSDKKKTDKESLIGKRAGPPAKEKHSIKQKEKEVHKTIKKKFGIIGVLLINLAQIKKKGLTYFFLSDPEQAIKSIKIGANETLQLQVARKNLEILGVSKEVIYHLDGLINSIHKEMIDTLNQIEEN